MIRIPELRAGTSSPSAIFHQARQRFVMSHAVRNAPRPWWRHSTLACGAMRTCIWVHRPLRPGGPVGWTALGLSPKDQPDNRRALAWAQRNGLAVLEVPLADPQRVFVKAAREFGLSCIACRGAVPFPATGWTNRVFCDRCSRRAPSSIEEMALLVHAIRREAGAVLRARRQIARAASDASARSSLRREGQGAS